MCTNRVPVACDENVVRRLPYYIYIYIFNFYQSMYGCHINFIYLLIVYNIFFFMHVFRGQITSACRGKILAQQAHSSAYIYIYLIMIFFITQYIFSITFSSFCKRIVTFRIFDNLRNAVCEITKAWYARSIDQPLNFLRSCLVV